MWRRVSTPLRWRRAAASLTVGVALLLAACAPMGGAATPTTTVQRTPTPPCATWQIISSPATRYQNSLLQAVSVLSPSVAWAVGETFSGEGPGATASSLVEWWDGSAWRVVTSFGAWHLNGVAAVSPRDVWAVGNAPVGASQPVTLADQDAAGYPAALVAHWNGVRWSVAASPSPSATYSTLTSVAAVSANDIWAVGAYTPTADVTLPLIERWDGTAWRTVASPSLAGVMESELRGIARIPGTNQLWAVGYALRGPRPAYEQALIERWNGTVWQVVAGPALPDGAYGGQLNGVVALSAADAWAIGSYTSSNHTTRALIAHWDGASWKLATAPDTWGSLAGVAAIGSQDVRAVGGSYTNAGGSALRAFALRWNGIVWVTSAIPFAPLSAATDLMALAADGAGGYWAVGYTIQPDTHFNTALIERCT